MTDYILLDGDSVNFQPTFGAATVVVQPGKLAGSSPNKVKGKPMCVKGDETQVAVPGCLYVAGAFSVPGTGTLKIDALGGDQVAKTTVGGKSVLLKGSQFTAKFEVVAPAKEPPPTNKPDTTTEYAGGQGSFTTLNTTWKGQ